MEDTRMQQSASSRVTVGPVPSHALPTAICVGGTLVVMANLTTPAMTTSTIAWLLMTGGILSRRSNPARHALMMATAIGLDVALVLALQFQRSAIQTAVSFTLSPLQQAHIAVSTAALLLYFPLAVLGWRQWKERRLGAAPAATSKRRKLHMKLGLAAYVLRTAGFLLMFSMLSHVRGPH